MLLKTVNVSELVWICDTVVDGKQLSCHISCSVASYRPDCIFLLKSDFRYGRLVYFVAQQAAFRFLYLVDKWLLKTVRTIISLHYIYIYIYTHTGCNRRNGPDFGRVFLRSNYTDITQNTYIQS